MTPRQRKLRAQIGAYALHAMGKTSTTAARAAFLGKFAAQVDPDGTLSPEERAHRAEAAKKLYFARLRLKASKSAP